MIRNLMFAALFALFCAPFAAQAADAPATAPAAPHAFFVNIKDGDTVTSPVKIKFGITGMEIAPAGTNKPGTGHFHLLIDTTLTDEQKKFAIPKDDQHLHFGKGQTEATVTLKPGKHTLQIVMGDGNHMLHNPPVMSDIITVTAK
jgi:hypothetical protein